MIAIWFRAEGCKPEKIDQAPKHEIAHLLYEYQLAFAVLPGQHRHGKDKVWAGRKKDEPKD